MTARRRIPRLCEQCGVTFEVTPWYLHRISGRWCSHTCHAAAAKKTLAARFANKVDVCVHGHACDTCCWLWTGTKNSDGYGLFVLMTSERSSGFKTVPAHRMSWELHHGQSLPKGTGSHVVRHTCGTRACCNPAHLIFGTQAENVQDSIQDGTMPRGEKNGLAKLTAADIPQIRAMYAQGSTKMAIARRFNVTHANIHAILIGKTWKHVA